MTSIGDELAVESYCFRNFTDNAQVARMVKDCGLRRIEICTRHADFENEATFDDVIGAYDDAGVEIVSVFPPAFADAEAKERGFFEFARRAGVQWVTANFSVAAWPECFATAERLAREYDVRLAIHNHGAGHWLGSAQMLQRVFSDTGERVGLCLDTAWALDSRLDPVEMVRRFSDRLYGIHLKDFVFDSAAHPEDVIIGEGNLDLPEFVRALGETNFGGYAVLEYEGDADDPVPALIRCVAAVKAVS